MRVTVSILAIILSAVFFQHAFGQSPQAQAVMEVSVQVVPSVSTSAESKMNGNVIQGTDPFEVGNLSLHGLTMNNVLISLPEEIQLFNKEGESISLSIFRDQNLAKGRELNIRGKLNGVATQNGLYKGAVETTIIYL